MTNDQKAEVKALLAELRTIRGRYSTVKVFACAAFAILAEPATMIGATREEYIALALGAWDQWRDPNFDPGTGN